MNRGIVFRVPQKTTDTLWQIFRNTSTEGYIWHIIKGQTEVWGENEGGDFFEKDFYGGEEFMNLVHRSHFVVFSKIQAYSCTDTVVSNIESYDDFTDSDCKLILLIYDCEYVEIYSKDDKVIGELLENARSNGYENIEYITDTNDRRTAMNVL